jgi:hypothetical protein
MSGEKAGASQNSQPASFPTPQSKHQEHEQKAGTKVSCGPVIFIVNPMPVLTVLDSDKLLILKDSWVYLGGLGMFLGALEHFWIIVGSYWTVCVRGMFI